MSRPAVGYYDPSCIHGIPFSQTCTACGRTVATQAEVSFWPIPYNYKCPRCNGEFRYWEEYENKASFPPVKYYGCPFCGLRKGGWTK